MNTTVSINSSSAASRYWPELKDLSDKAKLELIMMLSSSMVHRESDAEANKRWTDNFAGKWQDDRTSEEIVKDIREARNANMKEVVL